MNSQLKLMIRETFGKHKKCPLLVNDEVVPMEKGLETKGGFYKNGFTCGTLRGKKGKYDYLNIMIYTSAANQVDIEEKILLRIENDGNYTIRAYTGWHNMDFLCFGESVALEQLKGHADYFFKRLYPEKV